MDKHKIICLCLTMDLVSEAETQKRADETVQQYIRRLIRQDKPKKEIA